MGMVAGRMGRVAALPAIGLIALALDCTYDYGALQGGGREGGVPIVGPDEGDQDGGELGGSAGENTGLGGETTPAGGRPGAHDATGGRALSTGGTLSAPGGRPTTTGGVASGGSPSGGMGMGGVGASGGATLGTGGAAAGSPMGGATSNKGTAGAVTTTGGAGMGMGGAGGGASSSDLILRYDFEEATGTTVRDTSGASGGPHDGTLATFGAGGGAAFTSNKAVGTSALSFQGSGNASGGYVTAVSLAPLAPAAITLAAWVNVTAANAYQRVFDFGVGTTKYLFLTTHDFQDHVRFAISLNGISGEQALVAPTPLPLATWHHLVVVLPAGATYTGTLYVDGVAVATNSAMTLHVSDVGATTGNYLARSAFSADPYFNGVLDDFRVYRRALSAAEVVTLYGLRQ